MTRSLWFDSSYSGNRREQHGQTQPSHPVHTRDRYKRRANPSDSVCILAPLPLMTIPRRQQLALMIFAVAVIARLGFVAFHGSIATPDTSEYQLLARNLLRFNAFSASERPPLQSAISRPPVYPLFLALLLPAGHSAIVPAIAQSILDALVCVMVFLMASRVARRPFAVAVSLLYAPHP